MTPTFYPLKWHTTYSCAALNNLKSPINYLVLRLPRHPHSDGSQSAKTNYKPYLITDDYHIKHTHSPPHTHGQFRALAGVGECVICVDVFVCASFPNIS